MSSTSNPQAPSTTQAVSAVAQSRGEPVGAPASFEDGLPCRGEKDQFILGPRVEHGASCQPYERKPGDPIYRPLRIYTLDPSASRLEGAVATVNVPYEELTPGPVGALFEIDDYNSTTNTRYRRVDLDDRGVLIRDGRDPSPSDVRFHQQMTYAVCSMVYATFRKALGRHITWGLDAPVRRSNDGRVRLLVRPHAFERRNAFYDTAKGQLCFGYYCAGKMVTGRNLPWGHVFTCLSHDIVAHEVTHALLDGLRSHFKVPSGPDVTAFHEAFADLVAIFQHFSYQEVVRTAIRKSRGRLERGTVLSELARQFGHTTGKAGPLRSGITVGENGSIVRDPYRADMEPHKLGSVLVSAVFEAFTTVYKRKTERYVRLATGGSELPSTSEMSTDLLDVLADEASQLASQFLNMCIRAIDYCPPVDIEFGEYLRAVITADFDLVEDDRWAYREAWIDAFENREIYPYGASSLSEDALLWKRPECELGVLEELSFKKLQFEGDPASPARAGELRRQACALGQFLSGEEVLEQFGMVSSGTLDGDLVDLPIVQSIRSSRRVGPNGQVVFDLVAEVSQRRQVRDPSGEFDFFGGATVILGPKGDIRYVVAKSIRNQDRIERQRQFQQTGGQYWKKENGRWKETAQLFELLHN
jgi:hypothetical protein